MGIISFISTNTTLSACFRKNIQKWLPTLRNRLDEHIQFRPFLEANTVVFDPAKSHFFYGLNITKQIIHQFFFPMDIFLQFFWKFSVFLNSLNIGLNRRHKARFFEFCFCKQTFLRFSRDTPVFESARKFLLVRI